MIGYRLLVGIEGREMRLASIISRFVQPDLGKPSTKIREWAKLGG